VVTFADRHPVQECHPGADPRVRVNDDAPRGMRQSQARAALDHRRQLGADEQLQVHEVQGKPQRAQQEVTAPGGILAQSERENRQLVQRHAVAGEICLQGSTEFTPLHRRS
jgi:hypothetical protein